MVYPRARPDCAPLSFAQQRLWLLDQLDPGLSTYNLLLAMRLTGGLRAEAMERAIDGVVRRHEVLRTTIGEADGEPVQVIAPELHVPLLLRDLRELPGEEREARARQAMRAQEGTPFDLRRGPLLRAELLRLSDEEHVLLLAVHHIVSDAWSLGVLFSEIEAHADAFANGKAPSFAPLPIQYADYAVWQRDYLRGETLERHLAFWRERLAGAPALLELPTDRPRPKVRSFRGTEYTVPLTAGIGERLRDLGAEEYATPFMVLLTAFNVLLYRYTGEQDLVVGTVVANRTLPESEGLIGFFVNTLVMRTDLSGDPSFRELLGRVRDATLGVFAHWDVPFEKLVEELRPERSLSHNPFFQVMFVLQNVSQGALRLDGIGVEVVETEKTTSKFDLTLFVEVKNARPVLLLEYNTDLFDASTIERMAEHFRMLLDAAVEGPDGRITEVGFLSSAERVRILAEWNATERDYPAGACIHVLFADQARSTPDAVAVVHGEETLTYGELDRRANRLANALRRRGVGPEACVGVCMQRTPAMLVSLLGILKAGGAYVPLDPAYPPERIRSMIEDAAVGLVLTETPLLGALLGSGVAFLDLDTASEALVGESEAAPVTGVAPENLSYVIFTSGSTGRPKGVMLQHGGTVVFLRWMRELVPAEEWSSVLGSTSISFDVSVAEVFGTLCWGGKLVLVQNVLELSSVSEAEEVKLVTTVPTAAAELLRSGGIPRSVRAFNLAGEVLTPELARGLYALGHVEQVRNLYGPTEDTTYSTCALVEPGRERVGIGRPIADAQSYVLDPGLQPVPVGVAGQLFLGGDGLARGYVHRPGLTAERFVPNPHGVPGSRMYRTGDRARWRPDGTLEYLGRTDHQVKVRGFRIEPGEIETALREQEGVRDAVVTVREDTPEQKRLVAYVVPDEGAGVPTAELRARLAARLPEYMVPPAFVVLERLPLNSNGKVDRGALPAPEQGAGAAYVAPRTPVEEVVAGIWAEVLRLERVGAEEGFFELGGHSLLATQVVSRARQAFGVEVPLRALFEAPTVAALAGRIEVLRGAGASPAPPLVPVRRDGAPLPLSFAQQRLWFLDRLEPGSAAYNIPAALRLRGALDVAALGRVLGEVVRRHESLRTTFAEAAGGPVQVVHEAVPVALPVVDLCAGAAAEREAAVLRLAGEEARRPFHLAAGPLLRAALLRLADEEWVLLFTMHHAVSDGWSMGVLVREVSALYTAFSRSEEAELARLPVQYADYAVWQREYLAGEVLEAQLSWWRERLASAPPLLDLPTDRSRPAAASEQARVLPFTLPAEAVDALRALGRAEGSTLYMVLLAGFQVLLSRYAGEVDVSIGSPVAGRTRAETEGLIGFFVNTLVVRTDLAGDPSFRALLGRVREAALGAFAHQEVPFEKLVEELAPERSLARTPLFQVMFSLQNAERGELRLGDVRAEPAGVVGALAKFDLNLGVTEEGDGLAGSLTYRAELWDAATMERMLEHFRALLTALAAEPGRRLAELGMLSGQERRQVVEEWNASARAYPAGLTLHGLVQAQARRTPRAVALVFEGQTLTYAELEARAEALAVRLRALGVGPEARVGVCAERSPELVVALLGTLRAGGAYVPVDPGYPAERIAYMLADSGVPVLLTQERLAGGLPEFGGEVVLLDRADGAERAGYVRTPFPEVDPEGLAYVIYTSGSTGRPKGAMNAHRGIVNRLLWMQEQYELGAGDVVLQKTPFGFDVSVWELFWPLMTGARLVLARPGAHGDPRYLSEVIEREGVSTLHFVPPMLQAFLDAGEPGRCASLRRVMCSGEALPYELTERFREALPAAELHNLYGPTEAAVDVTYWKCEPRERRVVPIGCPVANTRLYVLDGAGEPAPVGVPGELFIGGLQVGRGYLGRAELTAEKFVPDALSGDRGVRLYRTGDRARWTLAGEVEYLGRMDFQVKVRGFRIELGEIEAALLGHAGVREAVVLAREDAPGDRRIVAYVVPGGEVAPESAELRTQLGKRLPEYMIPSAFVVLDALPLTPNGKMDRRALPAPEFAAVDGYVAPRTPVEEVVAGIWAEVLRLERVGAEEGFFELGGHSLLATQVVSRARQAFGVEVPLRALFEAPTVAALAGRIETLRGAGASPAPPLVPVRRDGAPLPLSFAQQRLWVVDRLEPDSPAYNMPFALRLRGALDTGALRASLDALVRRHETLRTTFAEQAGAPVQVVHPPAPVPLPLLDLRELPEAEREALAGRLASEESLRPFDLARGPLLRSTLLRLGEADHVLCFTLHHVVSDGWSMQVLVREVSALYAAFRRGEEPQLPELPVQYADYALWQREWLRGDVLEEQIGYWKQKLGGAPPLLEVPTDGARSASRSVRVGSHDFRLPAGVAGGLRELSRREGATLFMTLLAAWQGLLSRYSGQEDVVVGTPVAGRTRQETEGLIGFFVNMLALRAELGGDPTWGELLGRVRETALGAYEHQELPFERLVDELGVERSLTHTPVFQVIFAVQRPGGGERLSLGEVRVEQFGAGGRVAKFDLNLTMLDGEEALGGTLTYRAGLYDAETVARMGGHFEVLLEAMAAAHPGQRLSEVPLLRGAEREQLLHVSRGADTGYTGELCLHELVHVQVLRTPHAPALRFEGQGLSYAELFRRSCRLAQLLRREGVGAEVRVGICMEPAPEMIVAVLGVLLAGGAYLPLDPELPAERRAYMLRDAAPVLLLTQTALAERLQDCGVPLFLVDAQAERLARESDVAPVTGVLSDNLAYVIYTSGSTGRPKGVLVEHRCVGNTILELARIYGSGPGDRNLLYAPLHFDASVGDIFIALCSGAELVVARREAMLPGEDLLRLLREQRITHVKTMQSALAATPVEELPELRTLIAGGDKLPGEQLRRWSAAGRRFFNGYGATEASIRNTSSAYAAQEGDPPIGRTFGNTQLYVLDRWLEPVPVGVAGELYIGGVGVVRGYLGRPDLTAERFVPDPHRGVAGARLYRTGDLGRRRGDGEIEFQGRGDHQVKVRGYRVELGEIEGVLRTHAQVREAVVLQREDAPGQQRLVAYVVPEAGGEPGAAELRGHVAEQVPEYMVPGAFVVMEQLPVMANGKVDRRLLPAPERPPEDEHVAPRTVVEEVVAGIWAELLHLERVGVEENFFDVGGHSLLATQVVTRLRETLGIEVPLRAFFEQPTVEALARIAEDRLIGALDADQLAEHLELEPEQDPDFDENRGRAAW